jgi:hypothetical protein
MIRETRQLDLKMDQTVWIRIAPSAINLYDRDSGMAIPMETNNSSLGKEDSISEQPPTKGG